VQAIHDALLAQVRFLMSRGKLVKAAQLCSHLDQDIETIVRRLPEQDVRLPDLGQAMAQLLTDLPAINVATSDQPWHLLQIETEYQLQRQQLL
jgi:hypothetical protein